jgi:hypothetical protein
LRSVRLCKSEVILRTILHPIAALLFCCGVVAVPAQDGAPLQLKKTIALPGVEGRIDHFALDAAGDRLFVCALGNNTVEVLDLRKGQRIHSITGLGTPQGIAYIPELDRLFVANDKGGVCKIYDAKSYQAVGEINFRDDADNVHYDNSTKRIYVGFGSGGIGNHQRGGWEAGRVNQTRRASGSIRARKTGTSYFRKRPQLAASGGSRSRKKRSDYNLEDQWRARKFSNGAR